MQAPQDTARPRTPDPIAGVILAAGAGRRMGDRPDRPKQLLSFRGRPLLAHVVESARASRLAPLCVVLGHRAAEIRAQVDLAGLKVVVNLDHAGGQATSLRAGLAAVSDHCGAAMFLLGDQPLIGPRLIDRLIAAHRKGAAAITVPVRSGQRGNPVIVGAPLFPELMRLRGDTGARALFSAHTDKIQRVAVADAAVLTDVDDPADYAALLEKQ